MAAKEEEEDREADEPLPPNVLPSLGSKGEMNR